MSTFAHSHTVFLNRDMVTQVQGNSTTWRGMLCSPLGKILTDSGRGLSKVLTKIVPITLEMYESHVGCHSDEAGRMAGEMLLEFSGLETTHCC